MFGAWGLGVWDFKELGLYFERRFVRLVKNLKSGVSSGRLETELEVWSSRV